MQTQSNPTNARTNDRNGSQRPGRPAPNPYGGNFLLTPSLADNLTPDLALPEQYFDRQRCDDGLGPEKALMYAVLKDGIRCYYKNVGATRRKYKKMFAEAEEWLMQDTYEDAFSFASICDTLGIDPISLRERLVSWKESEMLRRERTGDTSSVQVGRSPFPTPVDLDSLDAKTDETPCEDADDQDDAWMSQDVVGFDDLTFQEQLEVAA